MRVEQPQDIKRFQDHVRLFFHRRREPCRQGNDCLIDGAHTSEYAHPCPYVSPHLVISIIDVYISLR
jgi:hypothetical protein